MSYIVRVFDYREPVASTYLAPAMKAASEISDAYFVRHWKQGPHWRIVLPDMPMRSIQAFTANLREHLELVKVTGERDEYRLSASNFSEDHQARLAELESDQGPFLPLMSDAHVDMIRAPERTEMVGGSAGAKALECFYVETTRSGLGVLEHLDHPAELRQFAFDLMIATVHAFSGVGLARGFVSFRSHSEAFLNWWPEGKGLREKWDRMSRKAAETLDERAHQIVTQLDCGEALSPLVESWLSSSSGTFQDSAYQISAGRLSIDPPWSTASRNDAPFDVSASPFHAAEQTGTTLNIIWFSQYRLLLNYSYLQLTRLGIKPGERFLLCHLAADCAERLFEVTASSKLLPGPGENASVSRAIERFRTVYEL